MEYFVTESFENEVKKLLRKHKYYGNLIQDVCDFFKNLTYNQIDILVTDLVPATASGVKFKKTRIVNSLSPERGRSGGFRLYYFVHPNPKQICFHFIHPKAGSFGIESIGDQTKKDLLKSYFAKLQPVLKKKVDITKKLLEIKPK